MAIAKALRKDVYGEEGRMKDKEEGSREGKSDRECDQKEVR